MMIKKLELKQKLLQEVKAPNRIRTKRPYYLSKKELAYILEYVQAQKSLIEKLSKKDF